MNYRTISFRLGLAAGLTLSFAALGGFIPQSSAQSLGSAETFGVLGATTVTNTGATQVVGNVGVSPGSAITGFPPGVIIDGTLHAADGTATQAHADMATAYTGFSGLVSPPANNLTGQDLGGLTLTPGVYHFDTSATSGGVLTLDAQNDPNARFVIQVGTSLITTGASSVLLINQADARNVYFQVGSAVTLGSGSSFIGNLLAGTSVTAVGGTTVTGRLLALTGAVTMDTNQVTNPGLSSPTPTPTPSGTPTPTPTGTPPPTPPPGPAQLLNISTRLKVQTGEKVSIAGFIITGNATKKIMIRGMGPSLTNLTPVLANPALELHAADGSLIASNNNWKDTQQTAIENSTIPPGDDLESAIIVNLAPANYTAILSGQNGGSGLGLIEIYDLEAFSDSKLANLSTRGFVQVGDDVMIGGFILGNGSNSERVLIRALGPSITGIANPMANPTLSLFDSNGSLLAFDDDWQDDPSQAALIIESGIPPQDDLESAIVTILAPGAYTAIVAGTDGGTGIALAEVYHLTP
ncbi:MAG: ice-binding family protein [Chthoniobacterales bacterium]